MRARWPALVLLGTLAACGGGERPPAYLVYVHDRQGSLVAALDDQGREVWRSHEDAYGLVLESSGTPIPRGFLDQERDEETGFVQFHYRTYDPATAQWLTPDPALLAHPGKCVENPQLCNPYGYAGGRPTEWTDEDGRWVDRIWDPTTGVLTVRATLGVWGANAGEVAAAYQAGAAALSNDKIHFEVNVETYADRSDVPSWRNPVEANFSDPQRSAFTPATSDIALRSDAADPATRPLVAMHELGHASGAEEGYREINGRCVSNERGSVMGNFFDDHGGRFTLRDVLGVFLAPDESINQGLSLPPTDQLPSLPAPGAAPSQAPPASPDPANL